MSDNKINIAGASGSGISSGVLGYLVFRLKNSLAIGNQTFVDLISVSANEGNVSLSKTGGYVHRVEQLSYRPVADAGLDFSVQEGDTAHLDGTGSYDNDGDALTYHWISPVGITLDDATSETPGFVAPYVTKDTRYIFKLVVNDGTDDSDTALVTVTVLQLNRAPFADAGDDKSFIEGSSVSLDGSNSFDPDGDQLSYKWTSLDGIVLFNSAGVSPSFILPQVTQNTTFRFTLVVNDGVVDSETDTVAITSLQVNKKPVAFAGGDFTVNENEQAALDGSLSYDDDGDPITFSWSAPANVTLSSTTVAQPAFTAPAVHRDSVLSFTLVVNDGNKDSDPDEVLVTVKNIDILSTEARIDSVMLQDMLLFEVDNANNEVKLFMPYGYDVRSLAPEFKISDEAAIDPQSGSLHDFSLPVYYSVTAEDGTTVRTWKVFVVRSDRAVSRELNSGWSWLSLNVDPADRSISGIFNGLSLQELDYVKSDEYSSIYYPSTGWFGSLVTFPQKGMVRLRKATSETFTVSGHEINPEITPVPLVPGWNHVAYLLRANTAIDDAFKASSIPEGNIVLKGLEGSAVYYAGSGWTGELDSLKVLHGYKINVEQADTLIYDAAGVTKSAVVTDNSRDQLLDMYGLSPARFEYSSTLIATVLSSDGKDIVQKGDLLVAYHENECRGVTQAGYIPTLDKYVFVLTCYSNTGNEELTFKVRSSKYGKELLTNYEMKFEADAIDGKAGSPVPLLVDTPTAINEETGYNDLIIYPNPVKDNLSISASRIIDRIVIYNSSGSKILELLPNAKTVTIPVGHLSAGVYSVRIVIDNVVLNRKVVKASN